MLELSERQNRILDILIKEYIKNAQPVSSELLRKKLKMDICPATVRIELQKLTDMGYIEQPHISAGRVPTNRGYRFFVDRLFELNHDLAMEDFISQFGGIKEGIEDELKFVESLTKIMASLSSGLVFTYLEDKDFLWKDGWKEVFQNPEFKEPDFLNGFMEATDCLEKRIKEIPANAEIQVFIGDEEPFLKSENLSLIVSRTKFPGEQGIMAILGPNRMTYNKNISLINSLVKELENF